MKGLPRLKNWRFRFLLGSTSLSGKTEISSEDIVEKDVKINGYKGKQVTVKIPDGRIFIVNYIENNGNIYHISQEGLPEYQEELKKVVDTWLPDE